MASTPEDRGPDSVRVSKYDPSNPIHAGIVRTAGVNTHIETPHRNDAQKTIIMPVKKGAEAEPKLSGRHMTNEEHENYVVPEKHRLKMPEPTTPAKKPVKKVENKVNKGKKVSNLDKAIKAGSTVSGTGSPKLPKGFEHIQIHRIK